MNLQPRFGQSLTRREHQVAVALLFGHPRKTIAHELQIEIKTVDQHIFRLHAKLGVHRNTDLVRMLLSGS